MKKKISLKEIEVKSFVTHFEEQDSLTIKGGTSHQTMSPECNTGQVECGPGSTIGSMAACPSNGCSNNSCPEVNGCHAF